MVDINHFVKLTKHKLSEAFKEWIDKNLDRIDFKDEKIRERLKRKLKKELNDFERRKATVPVVVGFALWCFALINNLGVSSAIGVRGYVISDSTWEKGFDQKTTERLLYWINEAVKLIYFPIRL